MKKYNLDSDSNALDSEQEDTHDFEHSFNKVDEENFVNHKVKQALSSHPVGQQDMYASSLGLPFGWSERNIPNGKQLLEVAKASFERLKNYLENSLDPLSINQLEMTDETIRRVSEFQSFLPTSVTYTLSLKERFFAAASLDIWRALLMNLFFKATNYSEDKDVQAIMLAKIATELGVLASFQSDVQTAIQRLKNATDFALNIPLTNEESWLRAQIEHFHATCLQISLDDIQPRANDLLAKAKFHQDYFAQMRVYMTLSHIYNQYAEFKRGFVYGQQALSIAMAQQNRSYILYALTLLTPYVYETPHLRTYRHDIISYFHQKLKDTNNLRLQAIYLSQISPHLYRQKQYRQARKYYRQSIDLYQRMADNFNLARMYHGLGMTCTQLEKWDEAQTNFDHALKCYNDLKQLSDCVWIQHCIAWLNVKRGNVEKGIQLLQIACVAAKNLPLDIQRREILIKNIGKDLDDARSLLNSRV